MDNLLFLRPRHERRKMKKCFYDMAKKFPKLQCQFPQEPGCPEAVIESHSIQKAGALKSLSDKSNHVIRLEANITFDQPPKAGPKLVGINKASRFFALCGKHDTALFASIENNPLDPDNSEHLFLMAYRGFLRDYYAKHREVILNRQIRGLFSGDRATPHMALDFATRLLDATQSGLTRLEKVKEGFDRALINLSWEQDFRFWYTVLPTRDKIAAGSAFTPHFDFEGRQVNEMQDSFRPLNTVTITVCPIKDGTLISTCILKDHCPELVNFYTRLEAANGVQLELLVSDTLTRYCENIVFAPSHWKSMPEGKQDTIVEFFNATLLDKRPPFPGLEANLFR